MIITRVSLHRVAHAMRRDFISTTNLPETTGQRSRSRRATPLKQRHSGVFMRGAAFIFYAGAALFAFSQTPSLIQHIRFALWADVDAYPGLTDARTISGAVYDYPIAQIKQIAPFLVSGMVYGWEFSYTPSDRARQIEEYFELTPVQEDESYLQAIRYSEPWLSENQFNCWVEFMRTPDMVRTYNRWAAINHPTVRGRGSASVAHGFDGIKQATENAVKDAVRTYFRGRIKNKPKEITGRVLIRKQPDIGIRAGNYVIQLDFFLETDKIISYQLY